MRSSMAILSVLLAMSGPALAADQPPADFDWEQWRHLPVQDGGRQKPLDTLARESSQEMGKALTVTEPHSGRKLQATEAYLTMLFDWQGWDKPSASPPPGELSYQGSHGFDKWDRAELLSVGRSRIRKVLDMPEGTKHISPVKLQEAQVSDPHTNRRLPFSMWAQQIYYNKAEDEYGDFDKREAMELSNRLHSFQANRMGQGLKLIPVQGDQEQAWMSLADLMEGSFNADTDPSGEFQAAQQQFFAVRRAYLDGQAEAFDEASSEFMATLRKLGRWISLANLMHGPFTAEVERTNEFQAAQKQFSAAKKAYLDGQMDVFDKASAELFVTMRELGQEQKEYPAQSTISLEVAYNHWAPFHLAWIFTLIAAGVIILTVASGWKALYPVGLAALAASVGVLVAGLIVRWIIKESPPVTNLYESVVFAGFGTVLFGAWFGLRSGRRDMLAAAMVIATMILALADNCPAVLTPSIRPLPPVLRSNFWLAIHVMTIMLSYSQFALAVGIGNVTLGFYLFGSKNEEAIKALSRLTYRSLQAGTLLLLVGTLLGAAWADYSWGRFWGWDPKEVWALITLLGYLAILHARSAGIIGNRGLTAWTVACFSFVLFAWYGVNFLSGGLHNYGLSGGAGPVYMITAILLQWFYIIAAVVMSFVWSQSSVAQAN